MDPETLQTRDSLLSRLKDWEDAASWQDFFDSYWRLIYNVAMRAGLSDAEAQDVVQATVIGVAKNIHQFKKGHEFGSFKGWLLKMTHWRIIDQVRKRRPAEVQLDSTEEEERRTGLLEQVADPASLELDGVWEAEWEKRLLEAAIDRVKQTVEPEAYQLFDLHAVQGWAASRVAERLGVKLSQVYGAKYRVTEMIQREVRRLKREEE